MQMKKMTQVVVGALCISVSWLALFRIDAVAVHGLPDHERRRCEGRRQDDAGTNSVHGPRSADHRGGSQDGKSSTDEDAHAIQLPTDGSRGRTGKGDEYQLSQMDPRDALL